MREGDVGQAYMEVLQRCPEEEGLGLCGEPGFTRQGQMCASHACLFSGKIVTIEGSCCQAMHAMLG